MFLKYSKIPYLKGNGAECYDRSDGDFLFCERDQKQNYLQFSALQLQKAKDFSNTRVRCSTEVDVREAIEFERTTSDGEVQ